MTQAIALSCVVLVLLGAALVGGWNGFGLALIFIGGIGLLMLPMWGLILERD